MRKRLARAAMLVTAGLALTGCSRAGEGAGALTQNCLLVDSAGGVGWMSVETFEGEGYSKDEMLASAQEVIDAYNASLGEGAVAVSLVEGELENGRASLETAYDTPARLLDFAEEIGDYNVPFTLIETGSLSQLGDDLSGSGLTMENTSGKEMDMAAVLETQDAIVLKTEGSGLVRGEEKIRYVSGGCSLRDAYTVQTAEEGISYIIFSK